MQRTRGPWRAALILLVPLVIAACDHDEGDTAASSDVGAEEGSAGSDDSNGSDGSDGGDRAPLTCRDLMCPDGHVCVEPRAYCDESTDPPELRRDPAYCQPLVAPPERSAAAGELVLSSGIAMCEDAEQLVGPDGRIVVVCPNDGLACA